MGRKQDFSQSTIYHNRTIESKMVVYVGSTTSFKQRCSTHKSRCKNGYNSPIYIYISDNGGFEFYQIVPVAFLQLTDAIELRIEEHNEMDKYTDKLNAIKAYCSEQERLEQRKVYNEKNKDKHKAYLEQNKEVLKEKQKAYYEQNKEVIN
jgi:predicted GIY-YIG superfamily endonuclease